MQETQLTIIDQVKEVAAKSGVPLEIDITKLATLAERGKAIKDVNDPNFAVVKKEMQKTRTELTNYFMDARRGFNQLAEGVRDVEKAVLAEFTPEEQRLIALDKAEKERLLKEARIEALPAKRERITTAGIEFTDEEILALTDADFEIEYNVRLGAKLEADRIADQQRREAEQKQIDEEKARIEQEAKRIADEKVNGRKQRLFVAGFTETSTAAGKIYAYDAQLRISIQQIEEISDESFNTWFSQSEVYIAADKKHKAELEERRIAKEKQDAVDKAVKDAEAKAQLEKEALAKVQKEAEDKAKAEVEAKAKADAEAEAKRQADEKYQAFLLQNNYNQETDIIVDNGHNNEYRIYRFVAEFKS